MYPQLQRGDRLPTVAAVQILVNLAMREGEQLGVDGSFGSETETAVRNFQRGSLILRPTGRVDGGTWQRLTRNQDLRVIDTIDITEGDELTAEGADIRGAGGQPIEMGRMSMYLVRQVEQIMSRGRQGSVVLLRFFGHGRPGVQGALNARNVDRVAQFLARLRPIFSPYGSAELHGCRVGAGASGRRLVQQLSRAWGVPVTAGIRGQQAGGGRTFRFEGPTVTAFPRGGDLRRWARSLPQAQGLMSVSR